MCKHRWRELASERVSRQVVTYYKCIDCGLTYPSNSTNKKKNEIGIQGLIIF